MTSRHNVIIQTSSMQSIQPAPALIKIKMPEKINWGWQNNIKRIRFHFPFLHQTHWRQNTFKGFHLLCIVSNWDNQWSIHYVGIIFNSIWIKMSRRVNVRLRLNKKYLKKCLLTWMDVKLCVYPHPTENVYDAKNLRV